MTGSFPIRSMFLCLMLALLTINQAWPGNRETTKPSSEELKALQTITLFYKVTEQGIELHWSPANAAPSGGIKVTVSADNPEPMYPADGYVLWLPGVGHTSCLVPLEKATSAKPRYYRICSVKADNHNLSVAISNVVLVPPVGTTGEKSSAPKDVSGKAAPAATGNAGTDVPASKPAKTSKDIARKATTDANSSKETDVKPVEPTSVTALPAAALRRPGKAIVVGHENTDLSRIPPQTMEQVRKEFSIWYGHTSHGSQITSGMSAMNRLPYLFNRDGSGGALRYNEISGDLGQNGDDKWEQTTRRYLSGGGSANVIVWSWCGGVSKNTPEGIDRYLSLMDKLEADYPGRIFVYMTGHLDGSGKNGTLHRMNERIRAFCRENGKVLFDFADIESFDPSGTPFLEKFADDGCNYREGGRRQNWAKEWLAANPQHGFDLPPSAAHTDPLNGTLKARAFWHLLARLSGWQP